MDERLEKLLYQLTSFYPDNLPENSSLEKILNGYLHSSDMVRFEAYQVDKETTLQKESTLKVYPFSKINISGSLYDDDVADIVESLSTIEEKIDYLDEKQLFSTFSFNVISGNRTPVVYALDLKETFNANKTLTVYEDYFIRDNKLFLLPSFVRRQQLNLRHLYAFDIYVNDFSLEQNWGSLFQIETGLLLPRQQYQEVLKAFAKVIMSDLTIKDIEESIQSSTGWEGFRIEDYRTPYISYTKKKLYEEKKISPSHFLVSLPEYVVADKLRFNIVLALLGEAKELQTDFMLIFDIHRFDVMTPLDSLKDMMIENDEKDAVTSKDYQEISKITHKAIDDFFHFYSRYDSGFLYDKSFEYDMNYRRYQLLLDRDELSDTGKSFDVARIYKTDQFTAKHVSFPEIPRSFSASDAGDGTFNFEFYPNADGTKEIELLSSNDPLKGFEVVATIDNDPTKDKNIINYNAIQSGKRYYKVRGKADDYHSLKSLAIDINKL